MMAITTSSSIKVNPRPNGLTGNCVESLGAVFMDSGFGLCRLFFTRTFHTLFGCQTRIIFRFSPLHRALDVRWRRKFAGTGVSAMVGPLVYLAHDSPCKGKSSG